MGIFRQFPYSNFHEMNLDMLLNKMKELSLDFINLGKKFDDFVVETTSIIRDEVDKWLDEHPEATTTVMDGSITESKLSDDLKTDINKLLNNPIELSYNQHQYHDMKTIQGDDYVSTTDYAVLQSLAYNSLNGHLLIGFEHGTTSIGLLVETDKNFNVIKRKSINLEHCNDITFNPRTDKYYVVSGTDNPVVYVIDPYTLNLIETITLIGFDHGLAQLSYKEDENIYIATEYATNVTYKLDPDFQILEELFIQFKDPDINAQYDNIVSTDFQSSALYGNLFVSLYWIYSSGKFSIGRCNFWNLESNTLECSIDVPTDRYEEGEGIAFFDGKFTVIGYTREYLCSRNVYINKAVFEENNWIDITDAFRIDAAHTNQVVRARYNWVTKEVDLAITLVGMSFSDGWNDVITITKTAYQPIDYYYPINGILGETITPTLINARNKIRIRGITGGGTATTFFAARYYANGEPS